MRTRSDGYVKPNETVVIQKWSAAGSCSDPMYLRRDPDIVGSYCPETYTRTMNDIVTPDWNRRRSAGEIINNPYNKTEVTVRKSPISWYESRLKIRNSLCSGRTIPILFEGGRWSGKKTPEFALNVSYASTPSLSVDSITNEAVTGAFAKTNNQDAAGLVILAEGEKTIKSFIQMTVRAIKILRALRKWDTKGLRYELTPKELANRWMEGRYAIRPFVYDMRDCVKALTRDRNKKPLRQTYRSGAEDTSTASQSGVTMYTYPGYYQLIGTKTTVHTVSARSGVLTAVDEITESTIWGLNRPVEALWELIPFSFVVDWFFNVGKTLSSWSPHHGLRTLASWVVVTETILQALTINYAVNTWTPAPDQYESAIYASGGSWDTLTKKKWRTPSPNQPILPTFTVKLDAAKLLDLAIMGKRFLKVR